MSEPPADELENQTAPEEPEKIIPGDEGNQWEDFVKFMEQTADKSLVSLLRNSVLLKISEDSLTIGLQNTGLFTEEKRGQIEQAAKEFFAGDFKVLYEDSVDGIDHSVREKIEQERRKELEARKKAAETDSRVQQILVLFPNSKIKSIEIIEEKKNV